MEAVRIEDLVVGFAESELPRVQAMLNLTGKCFFSRNRWIINQGCERRPKSALY